MSSTFQKEEWTSTLKISLSEYAQAALDYVQAEPQHLRWGQFLINRFYQGVSDPEIFYEENNAIATKKFLKKYVDMEELI